MSITGSLRCSKEGFVCSILTGQVEIVYSSAMLDAVNLEVRSKSLWADSQTIPVGRFSEARPKLWYRE